jgi:hypothetical protein
VEVTVDGVLFFDVLHGQTGVVKSGVELHPVIGIQWRGWRRANMSLETILIIVVILALLGFFGRGFIFRG